MEEILSTKSFTTSCFHFIRMLDFDFVIENKNERAELWMLPFMWLISCRIRVVAWQQVHENRANTIGVLTFELDQY